ncbi:MAG: beta-N-acetylhexosaminidase [Anaerolineae bacterium]|nr:beta-N-acetylhexosaminidase [Anaerolineae bacterium]
MQLQSPTSLEVKIGQMLLVGFEGLTAPDYVLEWLRAGRIGGVILFARNVESPEQVAALTGSIHAAATYGAIVSIDQEGGTVARLREGFTQSPGAMALASARDGEALTEEVSAVLARELRALGIGWDYAPSVDLTYTAANPSVGTRSFGSDAETVARLATAAVRGFQREGVAACVKHFPGLGDTPIDTHMAMAVVDTPVEHLLQHDLVPYRATIDAGVASVMITHVIYSALDQEYAATLSPVVVHKLLREALGYDGVVTTDCLEMRAISDHYPPRESAVLSALGGMDAILFSHTRAWQEQAYDGLLEAARSGRLPLDVIDTANRRMLAFKQAYAGPPGDLHLIRATEHLRVMRAAARAGTTLLQAGTVLPLTDKDSVGVVEFASILESGIVENGGVTGFARLLKQRLPDARVLTLMSTDDPSAAEALAGQVDTLVLAVRNAHLIPEQLASAQRVMARAQRTALVCLRNPFDVTALPGADAVLCTCGDAEPSLEAAVAALLGDYVPEGALPVEVAGV